MPASSKVAISLRIATPHRAAEGRFTAPVPSRSRRSKSRSGGGAESPSELSGDPPGRAPISRRPCPPSSCAPASDSPSTSPLEPHRDRAADQAELLVLRDQVRVLARHVKVVRWRQADRLVLAALARPLPRPCAVAISSFPPLARA